jgi:hypothetical protein
MHAALEVNIPNYASAIVTANEFVEAIANKLYYISTICLNDLSCLCSALRWKQYQVREFAPARQREPFDASTLPIASRRKRLRPHAVVGYNLTDRHPDEPHLPHTNLRHRVAPRNARQPYRREALHVSAPRCPRGIRLPLRLGVLR